MKAAIIRGGSTERYEESLASGAHALSLLREVDRHELVDLFVDRAGVWHRRGQPVEPVTALRGVEAVWNLAPGVERTLEAIRYPFAGSKSIAAALASHPLRARGVYQTHNLPILRAVNLGPGASDSELIQIFRSLVMPVAIAPTHRRTRPAIVHSFSEFSQGVRDALSQAKEVIVEEYMQGKRIVAHVLAGGRGERLYAFLPAEVSRDGMHLVPSTASDSETREIERLARLAHDALGLGAYSASTFVLTPRGNIYIHATDPHPLLSKDSLFAKSMRATGWQGSAFAEHMLELGRVS